MTRKDFVLIARTIQLLPLTPTEKFTVAQHFANELVGTNARFDSARFISAACMPLEPSAMTTGAR